MNAALEYAASHTFSGDRVGRAGGTARSPLVPIGGVPVKGALSVITDGAEEIALLMSERIEKKSHASRSVKGSHLPPLIAIENIYGYLEKSKSELKRHELDSLATDLLSSHLADKPISFDFQSNEYTCTEKYLLLQYALQKGLSEFGFSNSVAWLENALSTLVDEAGETIQANLATIDVAVVYAESRDGIGLFQASVHTILGKPTLLQTFQEALALSGQGGVLLERGIVHLMAALGACLTASIPSIDKILLEKLVRDLYHLKSINTLKIECDCLVKSLQHQFKKNTW